MSSIFLWYTPARGVGSLLARTDDIDKQVAFLRGGCNDLETFLKHHCGKASPAARLRERGKVEWL